MSYKIITTIIFCLLTYLVHGQNIAIKKVKGGFYKAVHLKIENDSLNYLPCGKFKPIVLNDSILIMFSPFNDAPTSIFYFVFTKNEFHKIANYGIKIDLPRQYYLKGNKCGKKLIYQIYYDEPNSRNDKKITVIKEKYMNNPDEIVKNVCEKINSLRIEGLSCNVVIEKNN